MTDFSKAIPGKLALLLIASTLISSCQQEAEQPADSAANTTQPETETVLAETAVDAAMEHGLFPLPGLEDQVPELTMKTTVLMETTEGNLTIEVYPQAAPNAAERFIALVEDGYYDNIPVSRVIPGFMAQFGVNWRAEHSDWQDNNFDDDPTLFGLNRGTLAFAKAGANTNSTQVFINYTQNNYLAAPQYNFTVFGKVVQGMETVNSFIQVGDPSGGLDQGRLRFDGEAYLAEQAVSPSFIIKASLVE